MSFKVLSTYENFSSCTRTTRSKGLIEIECKLGLWSVSGADEDCVNSDALHYWSQYKNDGEYYKILGGKSPAERLSL